MKNIGLQLHNAAKTFAILGPQVDALMDKLDELFEEAINPRSPYQIIGESRSDDTQSDGDWVYTAILYDIPLTTKRTKVTHHIAIFATIYDENDKNNELNCEPSISILFGKGDKDEPFEIEDCFLSSISDSVIVECNLKVSNHKLLAWDAEEYGEGWMFVVPLAMLTPDNLPKEIIQPAISLLNGNSSEAAFEEDSIAFNFEITDNKLSIKK
jgi:hypothetical protein